MGQHFKRNRSVLLVTALMLAFSALFFLAGIMAMGSSKAHAEERASRELESRPGKDVAAESSRFLSASQGYVKSLLMEYADSPLLEENAKGQYAGNSLETMIDDVNAGHGAKEAILAVCERDGLDAATAAIGDLTEEQLAEIDKQAFRISSHPIGE